jgi:hypothetical protein
VRFSDPPDLILATNPSPLECNESADWRSAHRFRFDRYRAERETRNRECIEVTEVFDDWDFGAQKYRVYKTGRVAGVIDVQGIDTSQNCALFLELECGSPERNGWG